VWSSVVSKLAMSQNVRRLSSSSPAVRLRLGFNLMARASEGGGGALMGTMTFGEEEVLRYAAAVKNCNLPPPAPVVAPTPAAYPRKASTKS
jgi:hypothetical protein